MNFKKLIAAGSAAALMACASFTAFAGAPAVSIDKKDAKTGEKVVVTVVMDTAVGADSLMGNVSVSGLKIDSVSGGLSDSNKIGLAKGIDTTATYNCTVTAAEGEAYSFTLTNLSEGNIQENKETPLGNVSVNGEVPAAQTPDAPVVNPDTPVDPDAPADPTVPVAPGTTPEADGTVVEKPADNKTSFKTGDFGAVQLIKGLFR